MESNSTASVLAKLKIGADEFSDLTESSEKIIKFPVKCCIGASTLESTMIVRLKNYSIFNKCIPIVILMV